MNVYKYAHFGVEDFVEDDLFRFWVLDEDEKTEIFWNQFLERFPERESILMRAKELVQSLHAHFDEAINEVPDEQAIASFQKIEDELTEHPQGVNKWGQRIGWSVAASIVFVVAIGGLYISGKWPADKTITYSTGNGQRMHLLLPDSSHVKLNANSVLSFLPNNWKEKGAKEVYLEGEGFFKIAPKQSDEKFIVHSGGMEIAVLGTEFNVRSRGEKAEIVLEEGRIELSIEEQRITMNPGDYISYSESQKKIKSKKVKPSDYTAWKDGIVIFNKALSEVAADLEILYGVEFNIERENLKDRLIQLSVPADSLEQVLEILEIMYSEDINIQLEGEKVIIY